MKIVAAAASGKSGMSAITRLGLVAGIAIGVATPAWAELVIYHFDVQMGDATLIVDTRTQRTLLVDAGNRGYGRRVLAPSLKVLGYDRLTYFLATHYDADHIGGFDELAEAGITVSEAVLDRGDFTDRKKRSDQTNRLTQYGEYVEAARPFDRVTVAPGCNGPINLGPDVRVEIVAAAGKYLLGDCSVGDLGVSNRKDNDLSIALVVRLGDFSYFIGGDLTGGGNNTTPMESLASLRIGDIDVLKINHHGSETSSAAEFLQRLAPEVAIISVGNGGLNKVYKLPRQSVLDRLGDLDPRPELFLTHRGEGGTYPGGNVEDRNIVIFTDGASYTVNGILRPVDERLSE